MFGDGIIPGSRASLFLDILAISLWLVLFLQFLSIYAVKLERLYRYHKAMQIIISVLVGLLILMFEIEVRFIGWQHRAQDSPYFGSILYPVLLFHIVCAVSFLVLWVVAMKNALKHFTKPPRPSVFSPHHKRQGWITVWAMIFTVSTGWLFYYLAFLAD